MKVLTVVALFVLCSASVACMAKASSLPAPFVACRDIVDGATPVPGKEGARLVLGKMVVASAYTPQQAVRVHNLERWTYWMKAGVAVHSGNFTVTVTVPKAWRSRAGISWGSGAIVSSLRFSGCPTASLVSGWNGYVSTPVQY